MRKIEKQMLAAIEAKKTWKLDNTSVVYECELDTTTHARMEQAKVFLYGNHIATYLYREGKAEANAMTLYHWPTPTTKSRLRALGISVYTKDFVHYLNGKRVSIF
jgi:hypothetical protein